MEAIHNIYYTTVLSGLKTHRTKLDAAITVMQDLANTTTQLPDLIRRAAGTELVIPEQRKKRLPTTKKLLTKKERKKIASAAAKMRWDQYRKEKAAQ